VDIQLSRTGANGQWELLFSAVPNDGQEPWWVTPPISYDCYLKISNSENPDQYAISGPFTIDNSPVGIELDPVIEPEAVPANFALSGCAPNPFNPITTISYDVPESRGMVNIGIYDISGKMVKQLVHQYKAAGNYSVDWRGKDRSGRSMPTGVYFCRMTAPGYSRSIKLTLVQ
ncbi:T9SS type A sorting domain-containing protein, partial [bacterium]|nr:T9SS type A sorting domain-containing protein [bacterium]